MKISFRIVLALTFVLLVFWLWRSSGSYDSRVRAINLLIQNGNIGQLEPKRQSVLERQIKWIATSAGVKEQFKVNGTIVKGVLSFIVTKPVYKNLTRCGPGNAIYDSELDTVFIDEALAFPEELTVIGEDSDWSMVALETVGFVRGYLNFILAHELGHRQAGNRSAGFFHLNVSSLFGETRREEEEADRFAISTLARAYTKDDEETSDLLKFFDSREFLGFSGYSDMDIQQRYYVDVVASMIMMNKLLLFSQSPYSPYFFDNSHPNFIERTNQALETVEGKDILEQLRSNISVTVSELQRLKSLETIKFLEIHLETPLLRVRTSQSSLILGGRPLGRRMESSASDPGPALIYKIENEDILKSIDKGEKVISTKQPYMSFPEHSGENAARFIDEVFTGANASLAVQLFDRADFQLEKARFFTKNERGGLNFAGSGVKVKHPDGSEYEIPEENMREILRSQHGITTTGFSEGVVTGDAVYITVYQNSSFAGVLRFDLTLDKPSFLTLNLNEDIKQHIAVNSTAYPIGDDKFLVVVKESTEEESRWSLYVCGLNSNPTRVFDYEFLEEHIGSEGTAEYKRDLDPGVPQLFVISPQHVIVNFPNDSVYHVNLESHEGEIIFHPGYEKLRVNRISDRLIAIWTYNSYKLFVFDLENKRSS